MLEIKSLFDLRQFAIQQVGFALAKSNETFSVDELIEGTRKVVDYLKGDVLLPEYVKSVDPAEFMSRVLSNSSETKPHIAAEHDIC